MARGVVSGLVWGVVVGAGGLIAGNEVAPRVSLVAIDPPKAVEPSSPAVPTPPDAPVENPPELDTVTVPETVIPGAPPQPDTGEQTGAPTAQTAPAAKPDPAPVPGTDMRAPKPEAQAEVVTPAEEKPIIPGPESMPPSAAPVDEAPQSARAPEVPAEPAQTPAAPREEASAAPAQQPSEPAPVTPVPQAPEADTQVPAPVPSDVAEAPQETAPSEPPVNDEDVDIAALPDDTGPRILDTREGTLSGQVGNVTVGRLPSIGTDADADATAAPAPTAEPVGRALFDYAQSFDAPPDRPVMAIILIDQGGDISDADLANLPFPISFAIDPQRADAASRAARYRSAGQEVILIAELPTGAQPTDAAVTLEAAKSALGETVAVMDVPGAKFQTSRATAAQVVASAAQSGHGVITYARGLNAAQQVAEREGVPAAVVFRVFDGEGRTAPAMKRYLDQAAFRAGQTDGLITVGHLKPDTLSALAEWAAGSRAATVALAPVSTVLKAQIAQDPAPQQ